MYLRRFTVENIRSAPRVELSFKPGEEAGWHVLLGANGSGKSSLIRAFALVMMGEKEAYASRQDFERWMRIDTDKSVIDATVVADHEYDDVKGRGKAQSRPISLSVHLERTSLDGAVALRFTGSGHLRTVWGGGNGWFSASFGPFRRFTGGDNKYDRLFVTNKRLAPHLTALGEDVALTDAMGWLSSLYLQTLQDERHQLQTGRLELLSAVLTFLNDNHFLPYGAEICGLDGETVEVQDGNLFKISLDQLSDGYRSALSMVLELIRQMVELYGVDRMIESMTTVPGTVQASGVVMIDEIDVHLHPTWQRDIGQWLIKCFPRVQFIVTTHSPIVCRSVALADGQIKGTVWKLPNPGAEGQFRRIEGAELNQLVFGDVLDAYSTELFGSNVVRPETGVKKIERLAELNVKALLGRLSADEEAERKALRKAFPGDAGTLVEGGNAQI